MPANTRPDAPRDYQIQVARRAIQGNVIAVADTGSGKTLISVLILKRVVAKARDEFKRTGKRKTAFFVVNKVPLVYQQRDYILSNSDLSTEGICGAMGADNFDQARWNDIFQASEVVVLTGQILLNILRHAFLSIQNCSIIIFDECHHASGRHCYRLIMEEFYADAAPGQRPKIFGMTASPPKDKGAIGFSAADLEKTLVSQIITASFDDISQFTRRAEERTVWYHNPLDKTPPAEVASILSKAAYSALHYLETFCGKHKSFKPVLGSYEYAVADLGPWCAALIWKYALRNLKEDLSSYGNAHLDGRLESISTAQTIADSLDIIQLDKDLHQVSDKLRVLVDILRESRSEGFCGILFVERRPAAHVICEFLNACSEFGAEFGLEFLKPVVLTGHGSKGDAHQHKMQLKDQRRILDGFRHGKYNLLVATDVVEEGLDIDRCQRVIRFDIKTTLISFIQSRGRARDPESIYIIMQPYGEASFLDKMKVQENLMKMWCSNLPCDRVVRLWSKNHLIDNDDSDDDSCSSQLPSSEKNFTVQETGARLTLNSAISLLYQYCASLPADAYCRLLPEFDLVDHSPGGWQYRITLPPNAPLSVAESSTLSSKSLAKRSAAFQVCKKLYQLGAFTTHLLPHKRHQMKDESDGEEFSADDGLRKSMKIYPVCWPGFWKSLVTVPAAQETAANPAQNLYMTLFFLRDQDVPGTKSHSLFRGLCLLTRSKLPTFDPMELFMEGGPRLVDMFVVHEPVQLSAEQIQQLHQFTERLFSTIYRKPVMIGDLESGVRYIIAPLSSAVEMTRERSPTGDIDWEQVKYVLCSSADLVDLQETDLEWTGLQDLAICETIDRGRLYFPTRLCSDLTLLSPIPSSVAETRESCQGFETFEAFYRDKLGVTIMNPQQPLIEVERFVKPMDLLRTSKRQTAARTSSARFLVPELSQRSTFAASVLRSGSWMVSALVRLEGLLKAREFLSDFGLLDSIPVTSMMEALTTSETEYSMNYQRLELLGDTFLKLITSVDLFIQEPFYDEGLLTQARTRLISNRKLFQTAQKLHLDRYIIKAPLPEFSKTNKNHDTRDADIELASQWLISDKTMADLVESTMGAAYLAGGLELGLQVAQKLMVPLKDIKEWRDFSTAFSQMPRSTTNDTPGTTDFPDLGNFERIEASIGYVFSDQLLLVEALTHASCIDPGAKCYQRLEFLGDAVLDMMVAEYWVNKYPHCGPGLLHEIKSACVNNQVLGVMCLQLGLHRSIRHFSSSLASDITRAVQTLEDIKEEGINNPELLEGEFWQEFQLSKVLCDVLESVVAAIYLDSGLDYSVVLSFFRRAILPTLERHVSLETLKRHPVTVFTEQVQLAGCQVAKFVNLTAPTVPEKVDSASSFPTVQTGEEVQECALMIHEHVVVRVRDGRMNVARKEVARQAMVLMEDPSWLEQYCTCVCRKKSRQPDNSV